MLTLPDMNRLKVFYFVYMNNSIIRAASDLNVTRSAVSQSLKALEEEVRAPLFVRDSKKMQPTPVATALFKLMGPFFQELSGALRQIEMGRRYPSGHLKIGAPLDFGSGFLTSLITKFRKKYPTVTFELVLGAPIKQLEMLIDGKVDIAFIDNGDVFVKNYPISIDTVEREEFVLTADAKFYSENVAGDHSLKNLQAQPFVDYLPHAPVARMWFKHHFNKNISDLQVIYSAESVRGVHQAIAQKMGIGVLPARFALAAKSQLKIISTERKALINHITLALPLSKKLSLTEKTFIQFYKEHAQSLGT